MPTIASAKKRMRQNRVRRQRNRKRLSRLRTELRQLEDTIASGDPEAAREQFRETQAVLDRSAQKGLIHPNKAARKKARLSKRIAGLSA